MAKIAKGELGSREPARMPKPCCRRSFRLLSGAALGGERTFVVSANWSDHLAEIGHSGDEETHSSLRHRKVAVSPKRTTPPLICGTIALPVQWIIIVFTGYIYWLTSALSYRQPAPEIIASIDQKTVMH